MIYLNGSYLKFEYDYNNENDINELLNEIILMK